MRCTVRSNVDAERDQRANSIPDQTCGPAWLVESRSFARGATRSKSSFPIWQVTYPNGERFELHPGDFWPRHDLPVLFETTQLVPESFAGMPVEVELWLGGEGFVQTIDWLPGWFERDAPPISSARACRRKRADFDTGRGRAEGNLRIRHPRTAHRAVVAGCPASRGSCPRTRSDHGSRRVCALGDHEVVPFLFDAAETALSELAAALAHLDRDIGFPVRAWLRDRHRRRRAPHALRLAGRRGPRQSPLDHAGVESCRIQTISPQSRRKPTKPSSTPASCWLDRLDQIKPGLSSGRSPLSHRTRAHRPCLALAIGRNPPQDPANLVVGAESDGSLS